MKSIIPEWSGPEAITEYRVSRFSPAWSAMAKASDIAQTVVMAKKLLISFRVWPEEIGPT